MNPNFKQSSHLQVPSLISESYFPSLKLNLRSHIRRNPQVALITLRPLVLATLHLDISFQPEIPTPQQLDHHDLNLITRKEASGTSVIPVAEYKGVGGCGDELMAVLFPFHGTKVVEAEAVEF